MSFATRLILPLIAFIAAILPVQAAPALALLPTAGPPTTSVRVNATGFAANALIDVYFGTTHKCLTFATPAGAATCAFRVPRDTQPQQVWVSAVQRSTLAGVQKPFTVRTDWTHYHGVDAAQSGRNPYENTLNSSNVADLGILWKARIGPLGTLGTPVVYGGRVFIKGHDGKLYGFDAETGVTASGFPKTLGASGGWGSVAAGYGNLYVGTNHTEQKLYAFNAQTGATVPGFPIQLDGPVESTPAVAYGNVYVTTYSPTGKLYAFNATTGANVPGFPKALGDTGFSTPALSGGRVYVNHSGINHGLHVYNAYTGIAIGTAGFGNLQTVPAIAGGVVQYANDDGALMTQSLALDEDLGFTGYLAPQTHSSLAVGRNLVIRGANDGSLYAVEPPFTNISTPRWIAPLLYSWAVQGSPVIAGDLVFANNGCCLNAVALENGARLWSRHGIPTSGFASPAVANGIVYLGSSSTNGYLYAFSADALAPSSRLRGGALGVKPALANLTPDPTLKATGNAAN